MCVCSTVMCISECDAKVMCGVIKHIVAIFVLLFHFTGVLGFWVMFVCLFVYLLMISFLFACLWRTCLLVASKSKLGFLAQLVYYIYNFMHTYLPT